MPASDWDALKQRPQVSEAGFASIRHVATHMESSPASHALQDLASLTQLSRNRQKFSHISAGQADTLLGVLDQLWHAQCTDEQRLTAFKQVFQLLARWAHNSQLGPASLSHNRALESQLQTAIKGALQFLQSQWLAPVAATACILFLGIASKGASCTNEITFRPDCCSWLCQLPHCMLEARCLPVQSVLVKERVFCRMFNGAGGRHCIDGLHSAPVSEVSSS